MKDKRRVIGVARRLRSAFGALLRDESGQDTIEYAFIAGLIGLGAVVAVSGLASKVRLALSSIGSSLSGAV